LIAAAAASAAPPNLSSYQASLIRQRAAAVAAPAPAPPRVVTAPGGAFVPETVLREKLLFITLSVDAVNFN